MSSHPEALTAVEALRRACADVADSIGNLPPLSGGARDDELAKLDRKRERLAAELDRARALYVMLPAGADADALAAAINAASITPAPLHPGPGECCVGPIDETVRTAEPLDDGSTLVRTVEGGEYVVRETDVRFRDGTIVRANVPT